MSDAPTKIYHLTNQMNPALDGYYSDLKKVTDLMNHHAEVIGTYRIDEYSPDFQPYRTFTCVDENNKSIILYDEARGPVIQAWCITTIELK